MKTQLFVVVIGTLLLGALSGCRKEAPRPHKAPKKAQNQEQSAEGQVNRDPFGRELEPGETVISVEEKETKQVMVPQNNAKF